MQPHINDLSDLPWYEKSVVSAITCLLPEAVVYPLDRIKVRSIARQQNLASSFLHISDSYKIYKDILKLDSTSGLLYGIKGAIDMAVTQTLVRFLSYDLILGRQPVPDEYKHLQQKQTEYSNLEILMGTFVSSSFASLVSQPSEVLKLKIQLEPLGDQHTRMETYHQKTQRVLEYHNRNGKIFLTPALFEKTLQRNLYFTSEIGIFMGLRQALFPYIGPESKATQINVMLAGMAASAATLLSHPFEFLYTRIMIRDLQKFDQMNIVKYVKLAVDKEGITSLYKGVAPAILKNGIQNSLFMLLLQTYINYGGNELRYREYEKTVQQSRWKRG